MANKLHFQLPRHLPTFLMTETHKVVDRMRRNRFRECKPIIQSEAHNHDNLIIFNLDHLFD